MDYHQRARRAQELTSPRSDPHTSCFGPAVAQLTDLVASLGPRKQCEVQT